MMISCVQIYAKVVYLEEHGEIEIRIFELLETAMNEGFVEICAGNWETFV